jgi:membrane protease YdiL (CAAX protease family)
MIAACFATLGLAIAGLWVSRYVWVAALSIAIVLGYLSGVLSGPATIWIAGLAALCAQFSRAQQPPLAKAAAAGGIILLSAGLATHLLPGFHNPIVFHDVVLTPGATPYTLYFNFDKTIVGVLILGLCHPAMARSAHDWKLILRRTWPLVLVVDSVLIVVATTTGYLRFDPKWTASFWTWGADNLFFVCLAEEALFRGFIQRQLSVLGYPVPLVIAVSAGLFGLAHIAGGWAYVALATAAGVGYAIAYQRTQRIEAAMLTHFSLNAVHFLLFTYPRSA